MNRVVVRLTNAAETIQLSMLITYLKAKRLAYKATLTLIKELRKAIG